MQSNAVASEDLAGFAEEGRRFVWFGRRRGGPGPATATPTQRRQAAVTRTSGPSSPPISGH